MFRWFLCRPLTARPDCVWLSGLSRAKTGEVINVEVAMMSSFGAMAQRTRENYPEWRETRQGARIEQQLSPVSDDQNSRETP